MKKSLVKIVSTLFPNQVVNFAHKQLTNPQVTKIRPNEIVVLDKSEKETFRFKGFDIKLYTWKGGDDKILLIHGWEGQAGNFADIVERLVKQNYTVYSFDGPSHGFSSKGATSLFDFTDLVGVLIKRYGVSKLISHSFGAVVTTYALFNNKDINIERYVLLTTPDKLTERIDDISQYVGITDKVKGKLIKRLEEETKKDVTNLNVSNFVKDINVTKALIIHDKADKVIPLHRSKNVYNNWKNCEFVEIEGTGHFRILRTQSVIDMTLEFLKN